MADTPDLKVTIGDKDYWIDHDSWKREEQWMDKRHQEWMVASGLGWLLEFCANAQKTFGSK